MAYHPATGKQYFFVDKCLPFGSSISCAIFQQFSDTLKHIVEFTQKARRNILYAEITNYLDDFLFIAIMLDDCNGMIANFLWVCNKIGCPVSEEKTEQANEVMIFLGMLLNGRTHMISVPIEKHDKAFNLLVEGVNKRKVTIKYIQKLMGTLNFLNCAIVPGRAFTRMMYNKLKIRAKDGTLLKQYHHVNLTKDFLQDCRVWMVFLRNSSCLELCRPLIDLHTDNQAITLRFLTDASKNPRLRMGAVFDDQWLFYQWDYEFVTQNDPSIEFLEFFALAAAIATWGKLPQLQNMRVIIFCDNQAVIQMVNNYASSCPHCMNMIRFIDGLRHNRRIFVKFIRSKDNILADSLSRLDFPRFWKHASRITNPYPDQINPNFLPMDKAWNDFSQLI